MSAAALLAGTAAALGLAAAWQALAALDEAALARAGRRLAALRPPAQPSAADRRRLTVLGVLVLLAAGALLAGPPGALLLAAGGPAAVRAALAARARRRRRDLAAGLPALARAVADALAAGCSVRGALVAAGREGGVPDAAGQELERMAAGLELGGSTAEVLDGLQRRAASPEADAVVAAILLQRDAGGDLAGLLRGIARRTEEARRAEADARGLTAQARFTAWLVAALPATAAGLAELSSPGYLAGLAAAPLSAALLGAAVVLQVAALLTVRRIARLEP